jgi:hypothetical protein
LPDPLTIPGLTENYTRYGILDPRNKGDQPYAGNLRYYDHFKEVFQSAASINNSVSVNGGGDRIDYNVAFSNNHINSPMLENNGYLDRTNLTANLGFELFKNFTVRTVTNLAYTRNTMHPRLGAPGKAYYGLGEDNAEVGGVYGFLNTSPFFSLMDTIEGRPLCFLSKSQLLKCQCFQPILQVGIHEGRRQAL